jgi:hypothetical protein
VVPWSTRNSEVHGQYAEQGDAGGHEHSRNAAAGERRLRLEVPGQAPRLDTIGWSSDKEDLRDAG